MKRTVSTLFKSLGIKGGVSKFAVSAMVVVAMLISSHAANAQTYLPSNQAVQLLTGNLSDLRTQINNTPSSAPTYKALEVKLALYQTILTQIQGGNSVQRSFEDGYRNVCEASVKFHNLDGTIKKNVYLEAFDLLTN